MREQFLKYALGPRGAKILSTLAKHSTEVADILASRVVIGWLNHGDIATLPPSIDFPATLSKSESGWSGRASLNGMVHQFSDVSTEHVAAVVSMIIGLPAKSIRVNNLDLARLGKTIDLLVKAQTMSHDAPDRGAHAGHIEADAHEAPVGPSKKPRLPKKPKPLQPKTNALNLTKQEAATKCGVCMAGQFQGARFTGCHCFRELHKNVICETTDIGYRLTFDSKWSTEDISTFIQTVRPNGKVAR